MCAKHYWNPTMLSKVTAKNVGDVFLRHTVSSFGCWSNGRVLFRDITISEIRRRKGALFLYSPWKMLKYYTSLSLILILTLISWADWSDKSEWYCRTAHCGPNKSGSLKERTQTSGEMGISCQRNWHRLRPIICRVVACAANQGVVVCGKEVCR